MERKTTSIKFDKDLWKEYKIMCATIDRNMNDLLEELVRDRLEKWEKDKSKKDSDK